MSAGEFARDDLGGEPSLPPLERVPPEPFRLPGTRGLRWRARFWLTTCGPTSRPRLALLLCLTGIVGMFLPVTTAPDTTSGRLVRALGASHTCRSAAGTATAGFRVGTGEAAGRLRVARASLVHHTIAATRTTTAAITTAATTSARVRRSGLTIARVRL